VRNFVKKVWIRSLKCWLVFECVVICVLCEAKYVDDDLNQGGAFGFLEASVRRQPYYYFVRGVF